MVLRKQGTRRRPRSKNIRLLAILVICQVLTFLGIHRGYGRIAIGQAAAKIGDNNIQQQPAEAATTVIAHQHNVTIKAIPQILIFTYHKNLLVDTLEDEEEIVLAANVRNSLAKHRLLPSSTQQIRFLTDADCISSLERVFPSLIPHFKNESKGMYKADICRGSALYETGGVYLDVDVGVRKDLFVDLLPETEFVTVWSYDKHRRNVDFFQAFMGCAPQSPIVYKYLELFLQHYTTAVGKVTSGWVGVVLLRKAWDIVYNPSTNQPPTELYREYLYDRQKHFPNLLPAPTWGKEGACHIFVVAKANSREVVEDKMNGKKIHYPLYSRIAGSRLCREEN